MAYPLSAAQEQLGQLVAEARDTHRAVTISEHGKAVAALISVDDLAELALRNLARLRSEDKSEDKDAFAQVRSAIAALADDPRPAGAVAWGTAGAYRLHADSARILYEVDEEAAALYVISIGIIS